ncbi:hypothetical protein [Arachidicoccus terrestris]|uniref:hypothetical protein n=1 Tax=Arachidicoccus terrestris TaxID=2875539 RepID=UPI001CC7AE58|nr:hypothetical protein [Arachidicoccus terrestris]UAY56797.1 hypothetical protein K9M52_07345 [Arachidicoccus terrestris]
MKKFIIIMSVMAGVLFMGKTQAQINISINIGSQPAWGPTGYNHVDYYYLPDINAYYNVATAQYIYWRGNKWRFANRLPNHYRNYNIYNSYKVVVNRQNPYLNNQYDVQHYSHYKGRTGQPMLRDDRRYTSMHNNNYNNYKGYGTVNRNSTTVTKRTTNKAVRNTGNGRGQKVKKVTRSSVQRSR